MEEKLEKTIRLIKFYNIKNKKQYLKLLENFDMLSLESLKYITQNRNSKEVLSILREAE